MAFENVGPQWDRDEPWQAQQARIGIRGLTDDSPWLRRQRRVLYAGMLGIVALIVLAVIVTSVLD